ncbi:MAG: DUF1127 domain-containing protein [Pseudomonadota bacterium]
MGFLNTRPAMAEGLTEALGAVNEGTRRRLYRYRIYRATLHELNALSDRELSDLGLRRGMIRGLAKEAALRG